MVVYQGRNQYKKGLSIYRYIFSIDMVETQKALSPYYIQDYKQHVKKKKTSTNVSNKT